VADPRIGFIGLGQMGGGVALNLRRAGYDVCVYDQRSAAADEQVSAGCVLGADVADVGERSDVVFTSLPDPRAVQAVAGGDRGLLASLRPGSAWFDLSTNAPSVIRKLHDEASQHDIAVLDAPVSGGPTGARSGHLTIWVGGDASVYERCRPVLDAISDNHQLMGDVGIASIVKLVHNTAGYAINVVMAEVFTAGVAAGADPLALWSALRAGGLGRIRTFDGLAQHFLPQSFDPPAFALQLAHKDVGLLAELGRENSVPLRVVSATLEEMTEAMNRGWGRRDSRVAMMLQVDRSGVDAEAMRCEPADLAKVLNNG
jgi:3-hydroxyisobutyrate dehydrogenase-like beta-hydroxyacid dehydrogenase